MSGAAAAFNILKTTYRSVCNVSESCKNETRARMHLTIESSILYNISAFNCTGISGGVCVSVVLSTIITINNIGFDS